MLHGVYQIRIRKDGTVLLPKAMRESLGGDVVVVGVNNHVEIWPVEEYEKMEAQSEAAFDDLIDFVYQKVGE